MFAYISFLHLTCVDLCQTRTGRRYNKTNVRWKGRRHTFRSVDMIFSGLTIQYVYLHTVGHLYIQTFAV